MRCGVAVVALNSQDWPRVVAEDWSRGPDIPDHVVWDNALEIGDMIEPLGFDSIWCSEHFGTPYGMTPNALQFLAYWAGRTEKVDLGTLVVVLPWHHPLKIAHEIAMLDILLKGRNYTVGVGRGLSPKEFAPLGVPQDEARQRFDEALEIIRLGLTTERFSYEGKIFRIADASVRPQPRHKNILQGAVAAFMTPTSLEAIARAGLGPIMVTQQSFDEVGRSMAAFNAIRRDAGLQPNAQPVLYLFAYCAENEAEVEKGYRYQAAIAADGALHYGFADPSTFSKIKGYERYAEVMKAAPPSTGVEGLPDRLRDSLVGTPDQLIAKVREMQRKTSAREIAVAFNFHGTIPQGDAKRSMKLFAKEVLPAIHGMGTPLHASAVPGGAA